MSIKESLKLRLEDINKLIELYKRRAIEELEKEKMVPATSDVLMLRDLKEQQLLIKQILEIKEEW